MAAAAWLFISVSSFIICGVISNPTGCVQKANNYDSVIPTRCTWGSYSSPLTRTAFTTYSWQRLELVEYQTSVSNSQFSGFSGASTASFDSSYPHSILIQCKKGIASFTISANAFTQFQNLQTLTIRNCPITSFPASALTGLFLDHLTIEGGSIQSIDAAVFTGLNISKLSIPDAVGGITIRNSPITSLPGGIFDSLTSMEHLALEGVNLDTMSTAYIGTLTNLKYLSISNNLISNITTGLFDSAKGLTYFDTGYNKWACTCSSLWFLEYSAINHIHILNGPLCETPASHSNKRATLYYEEVCATSDVCNGQVGMAMGSSCMPLYQLLSLILLAIIMIVAIVAIVLICKTRKDLQRVQRRMKTKRASSWNRVQEAMKKKSGAGQKPPVGKNGWI